MKNLKDELVAWVRDYFAKNGDENTKALIGISGGKDSTVVAAVCVEALGKERVIGVMMPNGVQSDIDDSKRLCEFLGIQNYTINIQTAYDGISSEIQTKVQGEFTPQYRTNTPSRLRMVTLYGVAAMIGNCRISNNGNLSERLMGYFTLWGDGAGDFAPLAHLYVSDVVAVGEQLGLPLDLVRKTPSDGMCGKSDEDNLGFSYAEVEKVARGLSSDINPVTAEKILKRINNMSWKCKLLGLPCFVPSQKILVVVDAQKDFIDGSLGVGTEKWNCAKKNIKKLIETEQYDKVIYTQDWHPADHCSFIVNGGPWPTHCEAGTKGAEIDADLKEILPLRCTYLKKGKNADCEEYGIDVLENDTNTNFKELHFVGLCYDYCVSACAKITAKNHPEAKVIIKKSATVAIDDTKKLNFGTLPVLVD